MPDQRGREDREPTKDRVKHFLKKKGLDPGDVGDKTRKALNSLSAAELDALDKVGAALEADGAPAQTARAVH